MVLRNSLILFLSMVFASTCMGQGRECNNLYPVKNEATNLYGYIDCNGTTVVKPQFQNAEFFSDRMGRVELDEKGTSYTGYVNSSGSIIKNYLWVNGQDFSEGLALVEFISKGKSKYTFIDKDGTIKIKVDDILKEKISSVSSFYNGLAVICYENKGCGAIDTTGNIIISPKFDYLGNFEDGIAEVGIGDKVGFISKKGEIFNFSEKTLIVKDGVAVFEKDEKNWTYLDKTGQEIFNISADHSRYFSDGLAVISFYKEGFLDKWKLVPISKNGYINKNGKVVIEPKFDSAGDFKFGMAEVQINGKSGVIDKTGEFILPPVYDSILSMDICGIFLVKKEGREFYIDKNLKLIWENKVPLFVD